MAKRDYYEVLGVQRGVSVEELKRSYRKIALENHPDRNPGDSAAEDRFKEASEAYAILSDPEKRQQYDTFGFSGVGGGGLSHRRPDTHLLGSGRVVEDGAPDGGAYRRCAQPIAHIADAW